MELLLTLESQPRHAFTYYAVSFETVTQSLPTRGRVSSHSSNPWPLMRFTTFGIGYNGNISNNFFAYYFFCFRDIRHLTCLQKKLGITLKVIS